MNTSSKSYWLILSFSLLGFIDSVYLTWIKLTSNKNACLPGLGDCWSVNTSRYSEIYGIPVALVGAAGYLVLIAIILAERWLPGKNLLLNAELGITLVGALFSLYLTYIEIAVLKAICPFCVISAIFMTVLLIFSIIRLRLYQMGKIIL